MKLVGKEDLYWPLWCQTVFSMRDDIEMRLSVTDYEKVRGTPGLVNCHVAQGSMVREVMDVAHQAIPSLFDERRFTGVRNVT